MAPDSFGSFLGCSLEHGGHAVTALPKSSFKGNLASWQHTILPGHDSGHFSYARNLLFFLKGQLLGLLPELGH